MKPTDEILDSWKQIAAFLRRGIRTVQRWERTEGLPVHRHHHLKRGSVYAVRTELTGWLQGRQTGMRTTPIPHDMRQFDRLRRLSRQQVALTAELIRLLESQAEARRQLRRATI